MYDNNELNWCGKNFKQFELDNFFKAIPFERKISQGGIKVLQLNYAYWKQGLLHCF